jgi:hypothetical protein
MNEQYASGCAVWLRGVHVTPYWKQGSVSETVCPYNVKKDIIFPVPSWDVTYQILPGVTSRLGTGKTKTRFTV